MLSISSIYKKHVLSMSNEHSEFEMDSFKNNNVFKFRQTNGK